MASILRIKGEMNKDYLCDILKWYKDQLENLRGSPGHYRVRRHIHSRINQINMIIFSRKEEIFLKALDVIFLLDDLNERKKNPYKVKTSEGVEEDASDFIFNLCEEKEWTNKEE